MTEHEKQICMQILLQHDAEIDALRRKLALKEESRREHINRNNMNRWEEFRQYNASREE